MSWDRVTERHIRLAIDYFEKNGVPPQREGRSTFLIEYGKRYPAKYIRGLAYRFSTGKELDPQEYSGGEETVRFFVSRGFTVEYQGKIIGRSAPKTNWTVQDQLCKQSNDTIQIKSEFPNSNERANGDQQKKALLRLLEELYGTVEKESKFTWLVIPTPQAMPDDIKIIYEALQEMRGFRDFITPGYSLSCDFLVPSRRLIIEYDERQHFTAARSLSLSRYPLNLPLHFDCQRWQFLCEKINARDSSPPYRDEQRAIYDSFRDIMAAKNGYSLIRLFHGDYNWLEANKSILEAIISSQTTNPSAVISAPPSSDQIKRVALVSHDLRITNELGFRDYSQHFDVINRICDSEDCDTILYALHTWDYRSPMERNHKKIFDGFRNIRRIIIEVGNPPVLGMDVQIEVWTNGMQTPLIVKQCFAKSSDSISSKEQFVTELDSRKVADGILIVCGESNIVSLRRNTDAIEDCYQIAKKLSSGDVKVVLNPLHDYMTRYEMKRKRAYLSQNGRIVLSVWNQGGHEREAETPWTLFKDGVEMTHMVHRIPSGITARPDIKIGIADIEN